MPRDSNFERRFLDRAEEIAGERIGWVVRVLARLAKGDELYGDEWETDSSIERLVREARDEYEDGPAWALLAAQRIYYHPDIDPGDKALMLDWLRQVAAAGCHADELCRRVLLRLPDGL